MAKGSAGEVESQLYVALDLRYVTVEQFNEIRDVTASTKRLIAGLMKYLRTAGLRGRKFREL